MSDVTELIAAIAAIAKDPKAWEKRLGDAAEIAQQLGEIRKTKKESDQASERASADLSTARYERGQAEHAQRAGAQQATANERRRVELDAREKAIAEREAAQQRIEATARAEFGRREADLEAREKIAAKKLGDASKLMAAYDEAKHQAALKLAS